MHCRVVDVGRVCKLGLAAHGLSEVFLFVSNVMLRNSNHTRILNTLDRLRHCHTGQDWIRTETFSLVRNPRHQRKSGK